MIVLGVGLLAESQSPIGTKVYSYYESRLPEVSEYRLASAIALGAVIQANPTWSAERQAEYAASRARALLKEWGKAAP